MELEARCRQLASPRSCNALAHQNPPRCSPPMAVWRDIINTRDGPAGVQPAGQRHNYGVARHRKYRHGARHLFAASRPVFEPRGKWLCRWTTSWAASRSWGGAAPRRASWRAASTRCCRPSRSSPNPGAMPTRRTPASGRCAREMVQIWEDVRTRKQIENTCCRPSRSSRTPGATPSGRTCASGRCVPLSYTVFTGISRSRFF